MAELLGKRILLVDDNKDFVNFMREVLKLQGIEVLCAHSGSEALEILQKEYSFDLVLMDIYMPGMDGLETTGMIRKMKKLNNLPVIIMTGGGEPDLFDRSMAEGAFDFIHKPFTSDELVKRITQIFEIMSD